MSSNSGFGRYLTDEHKATAHSSEAAQRRRDEREARERVNAARAAGREHRQRVADDRAAGTAGVVRREEARDAAERAGRGWFPDGTSPVKPSAWRTAPATIDEVGAGAVPCPGSSRWWGSSLSG